MASKDTVIAAISGIALGTIIGILIAPASGRDTRRKIAKRAVSMKDTLAFRVLEAEELITKMREKVAPAKDAETTA